MPPRARMKSSAIRSSSSSRDPRLEPLADVRDRLGDDVAGARDPVDLGGALADDHAARPVEQVERLGDLGRDLVDRALGLERDEPAARAVELDDRLRLLVVELEPPRDRVRRVVVAPLDHGALAQPLGRRHLDRGRRRAQRRARGRSRRASRRAPPPARGSAGSRRARSRAVASGSESRSRMSATVSSSGTSSPLARIGSTLRPSGVPRRDRRAEHVAGRDVRDSRPRRDRDACVPLPEPCGPSTSRFTAGSPRSCASSSATPSGASCRARRRRRSARTCRRARRRRPARSRRSG